MSRPSYAEHNPETCGRCRAIRNLPSYPNGGRWVIAIVTGAFLDGAVMSVTLPHANGVAVFIVMALVFIAGAASSLHVTSN